jgi:putative FmdB family regulatory protein
MCRAGPVLRACYTFLFGDFTRGAAVPLYEYKCLKCGRTTEKIESVSGPPLKKCPHCGGKVESVISAPAIQFKGSGWYVTDYAGKSPSSEGKDSGNSGDAKDSKDAAAKDGKAKDSAAKETTSSSEPAAKDKKTAKKK